MFKDLSRALHVKYCPPWKPASSAYLSPSSIHELVFIFCVCVLFCLDFSPNFTFFVCLFVLELAVLLPILHLTPSPPISSKIFFKKKSKSFFFLLLSSSCEIELAKEKKNVKCYRLCSSSVLSSIEVFSIILLK